MLYIAREVLLGKALLSEVVYLPVKEIVVGLAIAFTISYMPLMLGLALNLLGFRPLGPVASTTSARSKDTI